MTGREKQILDWLKLDPLMSQKELARRLGITRSSVAVHITNLIKKGYIKGKGYILQEEDYVVVIGGCNLDVTGFTEAPLIRKDSNPGKVQLSTGGVARNIAQNLVNLGIKTRLISVVGNDLFGRRILEDCSRGGIDTSLIKTSNRYSSSIYLSVIDDTGDMDLAINDMGIMEILDVETVKSYQSVLDAASAIVVDTNLSREVLVYLVDEYPNRLFLDTVSVAKTEKVTDLIGHFQTIKPNRQEAELLTGHKIKSLSDAKKAVRGLLSRGASSVIITLGKDGVVYGSNGLIDEIHPESIEKTNTTGSGDAFMAVLVHGHLCDLDIRETVKRSLAASILTMESSFSAHGGLSMELIKQRLLELNL